MKRAAGGAIEAYVENAPENPGRLAFAIFRGQTR